MKNRPHAALALAGALLLAGCELASGPGGPFADVAGSWTYTGTQLTPALSLNGTLIIDEQDGELILGSLSYDESNGLGGSVLDGGAVSGRVIGLEATDFDALLASGDRRHIARISANRDTIVGEWQQISSGEEGLFRATRNP